MIANNMADPEKKIKVDIIIVIVETPAEPNIPPVVNIQNTVDESLDMAALGECICENFTVYRYLHLI